MKSFLPVLGILTLNATRLFAAAPTPDHDLQHTLSAAAQEKKMAFILLGRPTCGNCNATKSMIQQGTIPVTASNYVMADLNIDDAKTHEAFMKKFGKEQFGNTLPFVVVTDSSGKVLASNGGFLPADKWTALLKKAKSGATSASTASQTSPSGSDWLFKKTAPKP